MVGSLRFFCDEKYTDRTQVGLEEEETVRPPAIG